MITDITGEFGERDSVLILETIFHGSTV